MPKSYQKDFSSLVSEMGGQDTLNDWDVLVSYNMKDLNKLLQERAQEIGMLSPLSFEAPHTDLLFEITTMISVKLQLSNPAIQFSDQNGNITFTASLSGSYQRPGSAKVVNFPDNLQLCIATGLVNVAGTWAAGEFKPKEADKNRASWIVELPQSTDITHCVCVNFNDITTVTIENAPGGKTESSKFPPIIALIDAYVIQHFKEVGLKYYLAGVNNSYHPDVKNAYVLQPTSFCFTVVPGDKKSIPATLCMWIGVAGSAVNGRQQSGQTLLAFAPKKDQLTPIPKGSTASVIFSHNIMANLFILPGLKESLNNVKCTSEVGKPGMKFEFNFPSAPVDIPHVSTKEGLPGFETIYYCSGCKFNLDQPTTTLEFSGDLASEKVVPATVAYENKQEMRWSESGSDDSRETGTIVATFKLSGTPQWDGSSNPSLHPNQLNLTFKMDKNLSCSVVAGSQNIWEQLLGGRENIPSEYEAVYPETPAIKIDPKSFDYFLTTNLLYPGAHIFIADPPAPKDKDSIPGLAIPRDTILTGRIKSV